MKQIPKKFYDIFMLPEMKILPGQLAFFIILAIFPLLTLIGYVGSNIELFSSSFISLMDRLVPQGVLNVLTPFITESKITGNIIFFMIIGVYLISNGTNCLIITSNELYEIEQGSFVKRRIKAFFMIILLMALFIFNVLVLAYGNVITQSIVHFELFSAVTTQLLVFFSLIKWPVAFVGMFLIIKLFYMLSPDEKIPSKYMNQGALFTASCWIIGTALYSLYISNFANYTMFYGGISMIIVMMIWIYYLSFILVMGIAINVSEYKNSEEKPNNNTIIG